MVGPTFVSKLIVRMFQKSPNQVIVPEGSASVAQNSENHLLFNNTEIKFNWSAREWGPFD